MTALILSGIDYTNLKEYFFQSGSNFYKWQLIHLSLVSIGLSLAFIKALILSGIDYTKLKQYSLSKGF